jgi:Cu/Ag efflux protein CusF
MKKMAWGLGVAAALALVAGQARAQSSTQSGSTNDNSATGSSGNTTDSSAGSMGTGSGSMGTGSGSMNSGSGSTSSGASASTDPSSSTSGHFDALTGKVQSFDRSSNELTLAGSDRKLKLDSSTKVMRDGSRASIDDIKEGDQVRASYSGAGDTLQVKSLDITSAGSMGSTPTTTKKKSAPHGGANAPSGNSSSSGTE